MHGLRQVLKDLPANAVFDISRQEGDISNELSLSIAGVREGQKKLPSVQIINNLGKGDNAKIPRELINMTSSLLASEAMAGQKLGLSSAQGAIVSVKALSTAAILDLKPGDRVIAIDGEKISSDLQLQQSLMQDQKAAHVLGVISKDRELRINIFRLADNLEENMKLDADLAHIFGISLAPVFKAGEVFMRQVGVGEALKRAISQTYAIAAMTGKSLWMLVSGAVPASQVGGPIMIFDVAKQAAHKGFSYYIFIMCLLSVNLGLLNLLPIPALDGGHLLLFGIEAVQRKPLTPKTRAIATQIGIALLLGLMALAIFNDLYRLFKY
jgi:regulator of sigma E protease